MEYNTITDTWVTKKDNPLQRNFGAAVAIDGKIYVLGGYYSKKNQIYDPTLDSWSEAAPIPDA